MDLDTKGEEAPRRLQGGNGALVAPPYEVRSTTNEVSEALTRRWAVGPANFAQKWPSTETEGDLELISFVSNPEGGNQAPSIRIWGRYIFSVFLPFANRFA